MYDYLEGAIALPPAQNTTENFYVGYPATNPTYASWPAADSRFMQEKCNVQNNCPGSIAVNGGQTDHYLNIVNTAHTWFGFGSSSNGASVLLNGVATGTLGLYLQEFY